MGQIAKSLFGGGSSDAKQQAQKSQELQRVANDRQLSELNRNDKAIATTRRAPRGRRLFEDGSDAMAGNLA